MIILIISDCINGHDCSDFLKLCYDVKSYCEKQKEQFICTNNPDTSYIEKLKLKKINEFGPFPTMVVVHETNKKVISGIVHIRAYIKNNTST